MILALDIGNTNVVLGCIEDGEILFTERMATDSGKTELDYAISLKMVLELREIKVSEITGAIIGSVVPPVTSLMREAIRKVTGQEALVVNVDMNIGLEVLMDNPSSVGTDLIVGAVAGINRYPVPLILIDMGTATTICVVNENKQYIGGMILPGIGVSMNSLAFQEFIDLPAYAVGTDDDHAFFQGFQFLLRIDDLYALLFQILHHLFIVDDGTVGIDRLLPRRYLIIYLLDCPLHAKAEASRLRNCDFHVPARHSSYSSSSWINKSPLSPS